LLVGAAPAAHTALVTATGAVDRVFATRSFVREPVDELRWPGPRPDIAVNLHGQGPQSHRALLATDPVRFIGYAQPTAGWPNGPEWSDDEHERIRWCRLLHWHGIPADPDDVGIAAPPPAADSAGVVVVHPGASGPERRWPVERFAAVARRLAGDGHRILISGSPGEAADAHALAKAAGLPPAAVLAGRTDIGALAALIAHARLLICGDTGVAHLATAYGTRSVVLFGPVSPALWGPPQGTGRHTVLWRGPAGLPGLGVAEVHAAACAQLAAAESEALVIDRRGGVPDAAATI
jgi:hypothetical protein